MPTHVVLLCRTKEWHAMKIEKGKLEKNDDVCAMLSVEGKPVVELNSVSAEKVDDILQALCRRASHCSGMASVSIRNRTRGWMMRLPLLLCRSVFSLRTKDALEAEGLCDKYGQLCLSFE